MPRSPRWDGDKLDALDLEPDDRLGRGRCSRQTLGIRQARTCALISPFIGGGFGGKLFVRADAVLAALGARARRAAGEGGAARGP